MRRKIWEDVDTQCSIIGTCLSLKELRKVARQCDMQLSKTASEFEVHATFVGLCGKKCAVAKAVNKLLDKKYVAAIRKFGKAQTPAELLGLWSEAKDQGDIPGPYWALMTHPSTNAAVRYQIFGDVHMLSHLVGSCNRADIRRLGEMERHLDRAKERHIRAREYYRAKVKHLVEENHTLHSRTLELDKQVEDLRQAASGLNNEELARENRALQSALADQSARLAKEATSKQSLETKLEAHATRMVLLEEELREKRAELKFVEKELHRFFDPSLLNGSCGSPCTDNCEAGCDMAGTDQCPRLSGKRILYVGGRMNLVCHYRQVVERLGGEFLHHDGGLEQTRHSLPKVLSSVDAVFCPVDCVSHDACQCVKEVCRQTMKPCRLLRSSGLSSLVRSLEEFVDMETPLNPNTQPM